MNRTTVKMRWTASRWISRCLLILLLFYAGITEAQINGTTGGIAPFGSYTADVLGAINAANLNLHSVIPIRYKDQFVAELQNENNIWSRVLVPGSGYYWVPTALNGSYFSLFTSLVNTLNRTRIGSICGDGSDNEYQWWSVDSGGFVHSYSLTDDKGCGGLPVNATGTDPYGYTFNTSASTVTDAGGNVTTGLGTPNHIADPNANTFLFNDSPGNYYYADYTGATFLTLQNFGSFTNNPIYQWTDANGNTQSISVTSSKYSIQSNFGCPSVIDGAPYNNVYLPVTILLPDTSSYSITWEQTPGYGSTYSTGRIASIKLPTGSSITYSYNGPNHGITCSDGGTSGFTRTTPDGTWTYSRTFNSSTSQWTVVITSPSGQKATYTFTGGGNTGAMWEVRRVYAESNGTIVATIDTCYNGNTNLSNCASTNSINNTGAPPTQTTAYTELPNSSGKVSRRDTFYDSASRVTRVDSYDVATGAAGALLRSVTYTYGSWNGSSCVAVGSNITDRPCQVTVLNGSGVTTSQVLNTYDSQGNLLSQQTLVSTGVYLTKSNTYNTNGTLATAKDVNGTVGTYSGYLCNGQFPGSYSVDGLSWSYTWDCDGGVRTSITDPNNQETRYVYSDVFWRLTSVTDPLSNLTAFSYTPNSVDTATVFNSNTSTTETVTTLDGIGRRSLVQRRLSPSSSLYDTVQYKYDANGRLFSSSQPCQVGLGTGCTTPVTTFGYDAEWRLLSTADGGGGTLSESYTSNDLLTTVGPAPSGENTKQKQLQYDGLGRLTSVCEITSASGSGSCGQSNSATGFLTEYAYNALGNLLTVTQNAQSSSNQQSRTYGYDSMGRLTSETNPENGTTSYAYDSDSTCGTSNGDLVKRVDAMGNVTCFAYDAMHRNTMISYPSGPYSSSTPTKYFVYDGATVDGQNMGYTKGRLAEAYTGSPSSKTTDIGFTYSPRGEVTSTWESTPHSGGFYQSTAAYWANGALQNLWISQIPDITYGVDGEGRMSTVSASAGQNPVTSASYNPASQATGVTFGSGDSDAFTFDPNTGRMTQYKYTVNGQAEIGTLGWNANATLGTLGITDPINAGDTQNCTYSHDDLTRVASANCGSVWGQTFSYDPFGNIDKAVTTTGISWQPTYNLKNQYQSLPGFTPSYDANGNLKADSFHNYTWDAEGKVSTIDSITFTYDALGRNVEQNRSGTYYQVVYSPLGTKLGMFIGQMLQQSFLPLPGGAQAEYLSWGLSDYRHPDWLGSDRLESTTSHAIVSAAAYAPFGEPYAQSGSYGEISFTGANKDTLWLDYDFLYREYDPKQGRWISPDPAGRSAADPTNPQTWNRYAYVLNNPLSATDPLGLECVWDDGSYDSNDDSFTGTSSSCGDAGGTWVDHSYFQQNGLADWSGDPNSDIANYAQNFTTTVTATPCSTTQSQTMAIASEYSSRFVAGMTVIPNVSVGAVKILTAGFGALASDTLGPVAPMGWGAALRLGWNGLGQVVAGTADAVYAVSGSKTADNVSNAAITFTTEAGVVTYAFTGNTRAGAIAGGIQNAVPTKLESWAAAEAITGLMEAGGALLGVNPCR